MAKKTDKVDAVAAPVSRMGIMKNLIEEERKRSIKEKTDMKFGTMADFNTTSLTYIQPTGWLAWDDLLKGYLPGRMYEIYGEESLIPLALLKSGEPINIGCVA